MNRGLGWLSYYLIHRLLKQLKAQSAFGVGGRVEGSQIIMFPHRANLDGPEPVNMSQPPHDPVSCLCFWTDLVRKGNSVTLAHTVISEKRGQAMYERRVARLKCSHPVRIQEIVLSTQLTEIKNRKACLARVQYVSCCCFSGFDKNKRRLQTTIPQPRANKHFFRVNVVSVQSFRDTLTDIGIQNSAIASSQLG